MKLIMSKRTLYSLCHHGLIKKESWWMPCTLLGIPIKIKRKMEYLDVETVNIPEVIIELIEANHRPLRITRRCT